MEQKSCKKCNGWWSWNFPMQIGLPEFLYHDPARHCHHDELEKPKEKCWLCDPSDPVSVKRRIDMYIPGLFAKFCPECGRAVNLEE